MSNNHQNRGNRRGYYISLGLCAVAICVGGFLYGRNLEPVDPVGGHPDQTVSGTLAGEDVPVVATKPHGDLQPQENTEPATVPPTQPEESLKTGWPLEGQTVASYAVDALAYNQTTRDWRTHDGLDIGADAGTPVCAAAEGTVYTVFEDETMGMTVVIRHRDGYVTQYASLAQEVLVAPGDQVELGQAIGAVGSTALLETAVGNHVHFSVRCNGDSVDPMDFLSME